jgi:SAM-dependent methyltransferase
VEALWNDVAAAYDRSFATLCAGTTEAVLSLLPPASRVLDVGCGSGHLTTATHEAGHAVHGVDPDPEMLALAQARTTADLCLGALPELPFDPASFDAVVANFVLNHVDAPRAAARGLARVARPGGRVVATIWPAYVPEHLTLWSALLDECGAVRPELPRLAPELDFERSPEGLGMLLSGAGLEVVGATTTAWEWRVRPEDFWAGATALGNFGVIWRAQSGEVQDRMRTRFPGLVKHRLDGDDLVFPVSAALAHATS